MSIHTLGKLTLITCAGLALGLGAAHVARHGTGVIAPWITNQWSGNGLASMQAAAQAAPVAFQPAPTALLESAVMLNGALRGTESGNVAMPHGARFQLRIGANHAGLLTVQAINPNGVANPQPLWQGEVLAGRPIVTPMLRLAGTRGVETVRMVLVSPGDGEIARNDLQLLHL